MQPNKQSYEFELYPYASLPIKHLKKRRYGNRGGGSKYFIDCSIYQKSPENIQTELLLRNVDSQNTAIIKAVATDETISKKNKKIVVKIGPSNDSTQREYKIGELLHKHKLPGFIRYICIFSCYDNTSETAPKIQANQSSIIYTSPICQADSIEKNKKDVLVAPYIQDGSIESFIWNTGNISILHNLILHTICSLAMAYNTIGFIHGDLHMGNVLMKRTKQTEFIYKIHRGKNPELNIKIPTLGYKTVLMDFEKSKSVLDTTNTQAFWKDVLFLCKRVESSFDGYEEYYLSWDTKNIFAFITQAIKTDHDLEMIEAFLDIVYDSHFEIHPLQKFSYVPL